MSTVQIVGIVVAVALVLLLIVALLVTRRRGQASGQEQAAASSAGSFLDQAPKDTFAGLGRVEQSVEDVTLDPVSEEIVGPRVGGDESWEADRGPTSGDEGATGPQGEMEVVGELAAAETLGETPGSNSFGESVADMPAETPAVFAGSEESGEATTPPASQSGDAGSTVLLSDIIVTTSNKLVDLRDADVRRMLTDLVKLEVDQAIEMRRLGQTVDAVMQLTEAEKISGALGLTESAQRIRSMIEEMHRSG
jgi:hypothetical protein